MRLFIKHLFFFTLILAGIFSLINFLQTYYNPNPEHYKKQYQSIVNFKSDYNGIILGTSRATHSIRPSVLDESGIHFYNYALNGSNPEFYFNWYNTFLHNNINKPAYCLFEVDFFLFDKKWLYRRFEHDAEYFPAKVYIEALIAKKELNKYDLIINRFPVLKYRKHITKSIKLARGHKAFNINTYDRGYISYINTLDEEVYEPRLKFSIDSGQVFYFKSLLKEMQADKIKIFFVVTPELGIDTTIYSKMESLRIIYSLSEKLNIPILNYNTELRSDINQNISLFADWSHMTDEGSMVFSKKLTLDLKARIHNDVLTKTGSDK